MEEDTLCCKEYLVTLPILVENPGPWSDIDLYMGHDIVIITFRMY